MKNKKISCTISGGDNMSGFNNCNVQFSLTLDEIKTLKYLEIDIEEIEDHINDYPEDPLNIGTSSPGIDFEDIIGQIKEKGYSNKEYVMVFRSIMRPEEENNFSVNVRGVECTNKSLDELNKTYYLHGGPFPDGSSKNDLSLLSDIDVKKVKEENGFYEDGSGSYFGYDIYELENFDLELELKTGY